MNFIWETDIQTDTFNWRQKHIENGDSMEKGGLRESQKRKRFDQYLAKDISEI